MRLLYNESNGQKVPLNSIDTNIQHSLKNASVFRG